MKSIKEKRVYKPLRCTTPKYFEPSTDKSTQNIKTLNRALKRTRRPSLEGGSLRSLTLPLLHAGIPWPLPYTMNAWITRVASRPVSVVEPWEETTALQVGSSCGRRSGAGTSAKTQRGRMNQTTRVYDCETRGIRLSPRIKHPLLI